MRQTPSILYVAVDDLVPVRGQAAIGFDEFSARLDHLGIPAVWLTSRSRLQFDEPRRKLGHAHPFIAEEGCGVYLPEDYFHLRPDSVTGRSGKAATMRIGRFTVIPIADPLPAASDALETLSQDAGVPIVSLRSLSSRELAQNTGLPPREAELARQRDFDELFFFAGVTPEQSDRFLESGRERGMQFRRRGVLWSVAIGCSLERCVAALSKLYDRALRYHAHSVAVATPDFAPALFPLCDRAVLLSHQEEEITMRHRPRLPRARQIPLHSPDAWEQLLESVAPEALR